MKKSILLALILTVTINAFSQNSSPICQEMSKMKNPTVSGTSSFNWNPGLSENGVAFTGTISWKFGTFGGVTLVGSFSATMTGSVAYIDGIAYSAQELGADVFSKIRPGTGTSSQMNQKAILYYDIYQGSHLIKSIQVSSYNYISDITTSYYEDMKKYFTQDEICSLFVNGFSVKISRVENMYFEGIREARYAIQAKKEKEALAKKNKEIQEANRYSQNTTNNSNSSNSYNSSNSGTNSSGYSGYNNTTTQSNNNYNQNSTEDYNRRIAEQNRIAQEQKNRENAERARRIIAENERIAAEGKKAIEQGVSDLTNLAITMINNKRANDEENRLRREAEAAAAERERLREEEMERQRLLEEENRNNFYNNSIPSQTMPTKYNSSLSEAYFFYVVRTNNNTICISTLFPLRKLSDDSWPYKSDVDNKFKTEIKTTDFKLVGFFSNINDAYNKQQKLIQSARAVGFDLNNVSFKFKDYTSNVQNENNEQTKKSTSNTDFWNR